MDITTMYSDDHKEANTNTNPIPSLNQNDRGVSHGSKNVIAISDCTHGLHLIIYPFHLVKVVA